MSINLRKMLNKNGLLGNVESSTGHKVCEVVFDNGVAYINICKVSGMEALCL